MNRRNRITYRRLAYTAVFFDRLDRLHQISGIVQRVKDSDNVDSVLYGFFDEFVNDIVRVMLISQKVLTSQEHLKPRVRHRRAQFAKSFPRIFVKKSHAGVESRSAPAFERPIAHAVKDLATGEHVLGLHPCCRLRLMRVAQDGVGYK